MGFKAAAVIVNDIGGEEEIRGPWVHEYVTDVVWFRYCYV